MYKNEVRKRAVSEIIEKKVIKVKKTENHFLWWFQILFIYNNSLVNVF